MRICIEPNETLDPPKMACTCTTVLYRRTVMCSNGLEREFFLAPDGSSFSGRKQAIEFMKKTGTGSEEDIRRMESGCKVVWISDDPTLPPGWKTRESIINSRQAMFTLKFFKVKYNLSIFYRV